MSADLAAAARQSIAHQRRMDIARRIVRSLLRQVGSPRRTTPAGTTLYLVPPRRGGPTNFSSPQ